ncbi:lysM domain receptor-like kinase 4 [Selaginella moellendorffii]|uniref:lysM domain receptor-like kinase 4 n=1 Tax=Selaginella moellendorffii TaxID=88036 RepID=UPI000D1C6432|nr:lysM domain receptor-like kinase 4 [Selaginella moellendorffii]|eukprot:XP_024534830.1 lysM domain receptor-like kinase 4 [Selaginella moellendorffii]
MLLLATMATIPAPSSSPRYAPFLPPLLLLLVITIAKLALSSQDYNEHDQLGYKCSDSPFFSSCPAQLVFLAKKGRSLQDISDQFKAPVPDILSSNPPDSINATFSIDQLLLVPVPCSCNSTTNRSSATVSYKVRPGDTYFSIANDVFHFLTTDTTIEASNPGMIPTQLAVGSQIQVPLRCACSDRVGLRLVTYVLGDVDRSPSVASVDAELGVDEKELLEENRLQNTKLQPGTTLLVPVRDGSTLKLPAVPAPPPPPADAPAIPPKRNGSEWKFYLGITSAAVGFFLLFLTAISVVVLKRRRKVAGKMVSDTIVLPSQDHKLLSPPFFSPKNSSTRPNGAKLSMPDVLDAVKPTWYSLQEIRDATGDFDPAARIPGSSSMYVAVLRGTKVAIKKAEDGTTSTRVLCRVHHANLIALVGACHDEDTNQTFLAYEFAENGSLRKCLAAARRSSLDGGDPSSRKSSPTGAFTAAPLDRGVILGWKMRLAIALDVARGLEYLHNYARPGFVHKNIRSSNVLLDAAYQAKISSFQKAKESEKFLGPSAPTEDLSTTIAIDSHSQGYKAPEYLLHGTVTTKIDVFAFGVVLLELLTGLEPIIQPSELRSWKRKGLPSGKINPVFLYEAIYSDLDREADSLLDWIDPALLEASDPDFSVQNAATLAFLARTCLEMDPKKRPTMRDLAWALSQMRDSPPV